MQKQANSSGRRWQPWLPITTSTAAALLLSACGGGGGSSSGSSATAEVGNKATACLNADRCDIGRHVDQSTRSSTEAIHIDSAVTQKTSFNNVANLTETESFEETGLPQAPDIVFQTLTRQRYTRLDGTTLRTFGEISSAPISNDPSLGGLLAPIISSLPLVNELTPVVTMLAHTPAIETRFDLKPGESYTQSYTSNSNTNVSVTGLTIPLILLETVNSAKTTYVGRERISVQAGSFEACKFVDEVTPQGGVTSVTTTWLAVGSGQFLKSQDASGKITELVDASIDGVAVQ